MTTTAREQEIRPFEVTNAQYPDEPTTYYATSAGKARYMAALDMTECWDVSMGEAFRLLRVRSLRRPRRQAPTTLEPWEHKLLRHAVGYGHRTSAPGWRDYYCVPLNNNRILSSLERMAERGLVTRGREINVGDSRCRYYFATEAGIEEACRPAPVGDAA